MLAPTRAIAGLVPVNAKDDRTIINLKINKLEEFNQLRQIEPLPGSLPESAQRCQELVFPLSWLNRKWMATFIKNWPKQK